MKWELTHCAFGDVSSYLDDGWEPFAVDGAGLSCDRTVIWLRRQVSA